MFIFFSCSDLPGSLIPLLSWGVILLLVPVQTPLVALPPTSASISQTRPAIRDGYLRTLGADELVSGF